jgi:hypothetical protein
VLDRSLGDSVVPIILVPSASLTLITIYNVKEFLEDGVFMPSEERMRATKGGKPESVTVQKKLIRTERAGGAVSFKVRDKPASLKSDDWGRVVAMFVLGKEWQFKDWLINQSNRAGNSSQVSDGAGAVLMKIYVALKKGLSILSVFRCPICPFVISSHCVCCRCHSDIYFAQIMVTFNIP